MKRNKLHILLCAALMSGCVEQSNDPFDEEVDAVDGETDAPGEGIDPGDAPFVGDNTQELAGTDPRLHWVLQTTVGQAKFIGVDPATGDAQTVNVSGTTARSGSRLASPATVSCGRTRTPSG